MFVATLPFFFFFFFFNDTATTEIYTLSLHDALPISAFGSPVLTVGFDSKPSPSLLAALGDRKSTRLNSSHVAISYAVFCLKKKKTTRNVYSLQKKKKKKKEKEKTKDIR